MNPYYPHLFSPLKVKNLIYRNRIFASPTGLKDLSDLNHLTVKGIDYFKRKAKGGAANVTMGEAYVHPTGVVDWSYKVKMYDIRSQAGIFDLAVAIHQYGSYACIELNHAGMHFHDDNRINYGPSDRVDEYDQQDGLGKRVHKIFEMPKNVIEEVVDAYGKAAARAKHCGFDSVLIHAGHGWLLSQFLSPVLNERKDNFGGSLENRARISLMVVDSIRKYCGPNFPIEFRVSAREGLTQGFQLDDTIQFCKWLEERGVDMIHVSSGSIHFLETVNLTDPPWFVTQEGVNVEAAAEIKKHLHIPVGVVGAITDPAYMEEIIASGKVDYVVLARAIIADPDLPLKAMNGNTEEIRPCLRCTSCMDGGYFNLPRYCSVNPVFGRDSLFVRPPYPVERKKVMIVGGGPAGMEAAVVAAKRGHNVILCEKDDRLGGLLNKIDGESFKIRVRQYKEYMIRQVKKHSIDLRLNTEVTPEYVKLINPDYLICAVGAKPVALPIPGYEKSIPILKLYIEDPDVGKTVLVLGGGFSGIEAAIALAMKGVKATVVEMSGEICSGPDVPFPGTGAMRKNALRFYAAEYGVDIMLNTKCIEITDTGMTCENAKGKRIELKADSVITAGGMKANSVLAESLRDTVINFRAIGDCYAPGLIRTAVRDGFDAAMCIGIYDPDNVY
jgi:2,4-dienoyl-CoA reductase-like NADH-dependent reductase (Old Yellow Enzyme family)/thioredoxin reductase